MNTTLKDYEDQKRIGQPLSFDPEKLGIRHAGLWKTIGERQREMKTPEKSSEIISSDVD